MIQPVLNRQDLLTAIDGTRATGVKPLTNWYATPERIDHWISCKSLFILPGENALLILRLDQGFRRVCHCAAELAALSPLLRSSRLEGILTVDLVGRPAELEPVIQIYRESCFAHHACLLRMIRLARESAPSNTVAEAAKSRDASAVAAFLESLLDPYRDAIPEKAEIRDAAERGNLLLVRSGESLGGILWFETTGITSHLRYWYVHGGFRGQGIGAYLMRQFLHLTANCRRIIAWVAKANADAIAKYCHYGFRPDTIVDQIMIRR